MKAIEKARKQEQMSTDGQSMASTVGTFGPVALSSKTPGNLLTPEDGSWLLAVPEELAAPLTVCALQ
jgi:hypothetical protein